jgi:hypothetical protein
VEEGLRYAPVPGMFRTTTEGILHLVPEQTLTYLPNLINRALQHLQVCWGESGKTHGSRAK